MDFVGEEKMNYSSVEKAANYERLLECARFFYEEYGIGNFTQEDLARKANLSVRTLQRHFPNREDLRNAVTEHLIEQWNTDILTEYYEKIATPMSALERLATFFKTHNNRLLKDYKAQVFIQGVDYHSRFESNSLNDYWQKYRGTSNLEKVFCTLLKAGQADGSIKPEIPLEPIVKIVPDLCSGLIQHLSNELHCGTLTYEDAVFYSDYWIKQHIMTLKK